MDELETIMNDGARREASGQGRESGASDTIQEMYGAILAPGAVAGSYVVDGYASRGGFASIYRAHHVRTGQAAALKVLHPALAQSRP